MPTQIAATPVIKGEEATEQATTDHPSSDQD